MFEDGYRKRRKQVDQASSALQVNLPAGGVRGCPVVSSTAAEVFTFQLVSQVSMSRISQHVGLGRSRGEGLLHAASRAGVLIAAGIAGVGVAREEVRRRGRGRRCRKDRAIAFWYRRRKELLWYRDGLPWESC